MRKPIDGLAERENRHGAELFSEELEEAYSLCRR
jgi:hypothetical protein